MNDKNARFVCRWCGQSAPDIFVHVEREHPKELHRAENDAKEMS